MTFTSIASRTSAPTTLKAAKLSKISIVISLLAIVGATIFQNLLLMSASHPAELSSTQKQALVNQSELKTVK
ncbi:MAG: hypothetical protein LH474_06340 [Chamaesiphon sp.]|nr:hypothetical protein [Chamaesiphon sp.]